MTYSELKNNQEIIAYINKGNSNLDVLGYTDHGRGHCVLVLERAADILRAFNFPEHDIELVKIAGFMHDIGNMVNRKHHAEYGAILANEFLKGTDMPLEDRVVVVSAIGNHDESTGGAKDPVSAALIIADKSDVRRNRVRHADLNFDIHDRVNYAVIESHLEIDKEKMNIVLNLDIDENICSMYDYYEIFLGRMVMCRRAAEFFGCKFILKANGRKVL